MLVQRVLTPTLSLSSSAKGRPQPSRSCVAVFRQRREPPQKTPAPFPARKKPTFSSRTVELRLEEEIVLPELFWALQGVRCLGCEASPGDLHRRQVVQDLTNTFGEYRKRRVGCHQKKTHTGSFRPGLQKVTPCCDAKRAPGLPSCVP